MQKIPLTSRQKRLADALKNNLLKRKQQQKERNEVLMPADEKNPQRVQINERKVLSEAVH